MRRERAMIKALREYDREKLYTGYKRVQSIGY